MGRKNICVSVDEGVKEQAENIFKFLGLNMSTAVTIFLNMCINVNGLPFPVRYPQPKREIMEDIEAPYNEQDGEGPFDTVEEMMEALNA